MRWFSRVAVVGACIVLTACGGGSGSRSGSGQAIATQPANATINAATAPLIVDGVFSSLALFRTLVDGINVVNMSPNDLARIQIGSGGLSWIALSIMLKVTQVLHLERFGGWNFPTVEQGAKDCVTSGFETYQFSVADQLVPTAGDSLIIDFSDCDNAGSSPNFFDGQLRVDVTFVDAEAITLVMRFEELFVSDEPYSVTLAGDMVLNFSRTLDYLSVYTDSMRISQGGEVTAFNKLSFLKRYLESGGGVFSSPVFDVAGQISSPLLGNSRTDFMAEQSLVKSKIEFIGLENGVLVFFGANNASLRVATLDDYSARLQVDADGDGHYEEIRDANWRELYTGILFP